MSESEPNTSDRKFVVDPRLEASGKRLIVCLVASVFVVFAITSMDAISNSSKIHDFVAGTLYWLCGDSSVFHGQVWRAVTVMWLHCGVWHIINNMGGLLVYWLMLSKHFSARSWFGTYILSGIISALLFLLVTPLGHADFSGWQGPLAAYFAEPNTPLAGASGAIMGLFGMAFAGAIRLQLLRKRPVVDHMKTGIVFFVVCFAVQFWFDNTNPGVAGLAHDFGLIVGFVAGMLLPMKVGTFVYANRCDVVTAQIRINRFKECEEIELELESSFDATRDGLVRIDYYVDYRLHWHMSRLEILAGQVSEFGDKSVLMACSAGMPLKDGTATTDLKKILVEEMAATAPVEVSA